TNNLGQATGTIFVTLDGVDVSGDRATPAILLNSSGNVLLLVQNSYVHGGKFGISDVQPLAPSSTITLVNNTLADNGTAISLLPPNNLGKTTAKYFNDLVINNQVAVDTSAGVSGEFGNNALFGNATNYSGTAVDGPGYM